MHSYKAEVAKRDAYFPVYLNLSLANDSLNQRDSVMPKFDINVKDDKKDEGILIYNSQEDKYIDTKYPYGVVIFKGTPMLRNLL
ncbi:hypothetical protein PRVXH_001261 [Proteinivorax hydrogeniformans]|uniref:Uncharacterized protein n=1 Tax=Proteinivorax hydrogeniformans TaxID=1826727 RepID=A0AAU8HX30_9FIRM